jgi:two-component system cell cycle sensor histidine kinase/response regulator CckA
VKILIVDDRPDNCYLLESLFKARGHQPISKNNGADALEVLKHEKVDIIISDILMPVMDGFQFCRIVKTDDALRTIPFIIYTATYTGRQDEAFALKIGANRFIEKPCEPDVLLAAVDDLLAENRGTEETPAEPVEEEEALKLYNERLVRKLEQKVLESEQEIKARNQAEQALRESQERLLAAQRLARMGDFSWDTGSGEVTWSEPLYEMVGYEKSEAITADLVMKQIHHPEDAVRIDAWLDSALASGEDVLPPYEYRILRKDGTALHVRTVGRIVRREGQPPLVFATIQDISDRLIAEAERDRLQQQLAQAQKMESVGQLAGGVAHDFNNILSVILGFTELCMGDVDPADPIYHNLEEIRQAALKSNDITRQLLAFARRQPISPQVIDPNEAIVGMLKMLRRLIGEDIELDCRTGRNAGHIRIDPSQLDQIIVNLAINARDAIGGIGKITIETDSIKVSDEQCRANPGFLPGHFVRITVRDNGCGMDADIIARLYEPFFTTKGFGKGSGLGLPTVYGIVRQNNGFLHVESQVGEGSAFFVHFPRQTGESVRPITRTEERTSRGNGETILVVEDEPPILKLCERVLTNLGFRVLASHRPTEAIRIASQHKGPIDLLLTDLVMPEMSGRDLATKLMAISPGLKVLYMSGYSPTAIAKQGVIEEGYNFIQKPFGIQALSAKVQAVLNE